MDDSNIIRIQSVSQVHVAAGVEPPLHPLIGITDVTKLSPAGVPEMQGAKIVSDLYAVFLKDGACGIDYGRTSYDFEQGVLSFMGPGHVFEANASHTPSTYGFALVFHPDLLRNFALGKTIRDYHFFDYAMHEALHLSQKEEDILTGIVGNINDELHSNTDRHSQEVIVQNLQLFFNYVQRYYDRQFITRVNSHSSVVTKVKELIEAYFESGDQLVHGMPSPEYLADQVHYSKNYLSDLLKRETGRSTKSHVDHHVVDLAKTALLHSERTVSEIAYDLGFNYPHYFSRMFKKYTGASPLDFRANGLN